MDFLPERKSCKIRSGMPPKTGGRRKPRLTMRKVPFDLLPRRLSIGWKSWCGIGGRAKSRHTKAVWSPPLQSPAVLHIQSTRPQ